jgi:hypothetical protein
MELGDEEEEVRGEDGAQSADWEHNKSGQLARSTSLSLVSTKFMKMMRMMTWMVEIIVAVAKRMSELMCGKIWPKMIGRRRMRDKAKCI